MKRIAGLALLIVGCACSGPPYYEKQSWAEKSYDQASAECRTEIQQPGGPPSYHLCMRGKGWSETHVCRQGLECLAER
jgi:hypothetical protein